MRFPWVREAAQVWHELLFIFSTKGGIE